jgi:replicative DNA helicase
LIDPNAAEYACGALTPADFYHTAHGTIFAAMQGLSAQKHAVDLVTVGDALRAAGKLDAVGGLLHLTELATNSPGGFAVATYATAILGASRLRALILTCDRMTNAAYTSPHTDAQAVLERAEQEVIALATRGEAANEVEAIGPIMIRALAEAEKRSKGEEDGARPLRMPWERARRALRPFLPGELIVVGARPRMGKTALAGNLLTEWAKQGHGCYFASMEMPRGHIGSRVMLGESNVPQGDLDRLEDGQLDEIEAADKLAALARGVGRAYDLPLYIGDRAAQSVSQVAAQIRRLNARGCPIRVAVVDYIQLARGEASRRGSRADEVSRLAADLKGLAKDEGITVIALSQLSRQVEAHDGRSSTRRPSLAHFKESGGIEEAADCAMALYRPSEYGDAECRAAGRPEGEAYKGITELIVLKQRKGQGFSTAVLAYDGPLYTFRDLRAGEESAVLSAKRGREE